MKKTKVIATGLALAFLLQVGQPLANFNSNSYSVAYASEAKASSIYDQYTFFVNEEGYFIIPTKDFFYNGEAYREDVLEVKIDKAIRDETLKEIKKFKEYAFHNIKKYGVNNKTNKMEYRTIGEWIVINDEDGKSKDQLKEAYINGIRWNPNEEIVALQTAYRKFTKGDADTGKSVKEYLDDYFYGKDENGKTIIDRYNDFQENYVKLVILNNINKSEGNFGWSGYYAGSFADRDFEILLGSSSDLALGQVSDGKDSYYGLSIDRTTESEEAPKDIKGKFKFNIGQKTKDDTSFEKSGKYEEHYYPFVRIKGIPYRQDILYVDQSLDLKHSVQNAIRDARKKAYDDGLTIYNADLRKIYASKEVSDDQYASPEVYDGFGEYFTGIHAYENLVSIKRGKEYYIDENRFPNGEGRNRGSGFTPIYMISKDKNLTGEDFINKILYEKQANGKSAYQMIKEGSDDPSLHDAKHLLFTDIQDYYITRFYTEDEVYYQLDYYYIYTDRGYQNKNMSGYKGSYQFTIGDENVNEAELETTRRNLAKQTYKSLIETNAAKILLEKSPKTISKIKPDLQKLVDDNDKLIDESLDYFRSGRFYDEPKDDALIEIMRYQFDKKIATDEQRHIAGSMFNNLSYSESSKLLLEKTPNTIKAIEPGLRKAVANSDELIKESLEILK